jgi:PPM family protein phosphatase
MKRERWNMGGVTRGPSDKISVPRGGRFEILTRVEGQRTRCQDRVEVFRRDDVVVVVVADGAGGTSGGEVAAVAVVEAVRRWFNENGSLLDPAALKQVLLEVGERLEGESVGQTTAIVVATDGSAVSGASVGDSEAWLIGADDLRDLSAGQPRKPSLGGGSVNPRTFKEQMQPGDTLLVATDGITKYVRAERICTVVRRADLSADDRGRSYRSVGAAPQRKSAR